MYSLLKTSYENAPLFVKKIVCCIPYRILAGSGYRRTLRLCEKLDRMSREEVLLHQQTQLRDLLQFAVEEVPFYRPLRRVVQRFHPFDALKEFPLLSKEMVQQSAPLLVPSSLDRIPHHRGTTGGSTGNQLVILEDESAYAREKAYIHAQWRRVGYAPQCRKATFRGVPFQKITDTCFWQENPIHNELQFSPFHMSEDNLPHYIRKLIVYQPQFLHGYPSAVDALAEYVLRHGLTPQLPRITAALLVSESCSPSQRERIESAFQTQVYSFYGHSERTVLGGECEKSRCYHAVPSYGVLEILNEKGEPCEVGESGEIVGTGFLKRAMPLIRYRTDDVAVRESYQCACGRCWDRFSNVLGRWTLEGSIIGKTGATISAAALNIHGDVFANVVRYQYYQEKQGELEIRVIPNTRFQERDSEGIRAAHEQKLWGEVRVRVVPVREIPLAPSGKQRRIVSMCAKEPPLRTESPIRTLQNRPPATEEVPWPQGVRG
ncbi:MAG TPA: AMP-binding protein [Sedimentisphaerales bacterium]|nr:AMP-binding protein [Sedimentisphaerales bacterium]HRS12422.1 AMP-binding protein [Sedimentisphaerales bacterium]HRV48936.1 AMP-binding protein [Sedimentisphaerales bacterium]